MAQIVVRNIPEEVMDGLRELAQQRGVSTEQAVRTLITDAVDAARRLERFRSKARAARKKLSRGGRRFSDSVADIRRDRDRR